MPSTVTLSLRLIVLAHFLFHSRAFGVEEINFGIIRYAKGELFMLAKGDKERKPISRMGKFYDGCELTTGANSFAILRLPDGSTLKLDPDSNLKVEGLIQAKGNTFKGSSYLILTIGGIMVDVVQKLSGPPSLEVETSNRISFGVRGTTFYVFHDAATSDVWGTVYKGQVEAMDYLHDDSEMIEPGMSLAVVEGEVITKPYKYKWPKRLRWSFEESETALETNRVNSAEERLKELQSLYQKLRTRSKRSFLKKKKTQEESLGNGYRTSESEYLLNETGMTASGQNETVIPSGEGQNAEIAATPTPAPAYTPVTPTPTPVFDSEPIILTTPTPVPVQNQNNQAAQQLIEEIQQLADQECAKITGAIAKLSCSPTEIDAAIISAGTKTFHCCVTISSNGNQN